jgi:hypothetical protein
MLGGGKGVGVGLGGAGVWVAVGTGASVTVGFGVPVAVGARVPVVVGALVGSGVRVLVLSEDGVMLGTVIVGRRVNVALGPCAIVGANVYGTGVVCAQAKRSTVRVATATRPISRFPVFIVPSCPHSSRNAEHHCRPRPPADEYRLAGGNGVSVGRGDCKGYRAARQATRAVDAPRHPTLIASLTNQIERCTIGQASGWELGRAVRSPIVFGLNRAGSESCHGRRVPS